MNTAGNVIREARKANNLTQKQLAELSGMAQSDISRVEGEEGNPSVQILDRIAQAMNMKLKVEFVEPMEEKKRRKAKARKKNTETE